MTEDISHDFIEYKKQHPEFFPADVPEDKQYLFYQGFVAREKEREVQRVSKVQSSVPEPIPERKQLNLIFVYGNYHCTDFGNADRLIAKTSGNIKYCATNDAWYIWNGDGYWKKDCISEIREYSKATMLSIYKEADYSDSLDAREAIKKWARACENSEHVNACIKLASSSPEVACLHDQFDRDAYLFNMVNGTYDLRNHMFLQHDKENYITRQVSYGYDATATCPKFLQFVERIFKSQKDKDKIIRYLQRAIGYTLTGEVSQQSIFLLHGAGSNGKSTLLEAMRMLLGDYGTTIASASLTTQKNEGVRNDIARLPKVRFVVASENAKGTFIDEDIVKKLTGGDEVTARFLFQEEFTFYPQLKLWWAFNHPPGLRDLTHSMMRRLKLIPFNETIGDNEKIDQRVLLESFRQELPGIFNWAIDGLKAFQRDGLADIDVIKTAVKEFKEDQDILFEWLLDNCYIPARDGQTDVAKLEDRSATVSALHSNYKMWAESHHEKVLSLKKFSMEMSERGFKRFHTEKGNAFHGICIK